MRGPLHRFLGADHRRLDGLLKRSAFEPDRVDLALFGEFRAGILRHIGMEERVLSILVPHNRREEEPGGVYDACDEALGPAESERVAAELQAFPDPPLKPYHDGPRVQRHIEETLLLARRQWGSGVGPATPPGSPAASRGR